MNSKTSMKVCLVCTAVSIGCIIIMVFLSGCTTYTPTRKRMVSAQERPIIATATYTFVRVKRYTCRKHGSQVASYEIDKKNYCTVCTLEQQVMGLEPMKEIEE